MIRINLLTTERERARKTAGFQLAPQRITIACSLVLVAAALGIGWWYWSLSTESAQMDLAIASAQKETARLRSLIQQVRQFEQRRAQLQQRVTLIEQLRRGQSAPVHILDQVSRSVPEMLWLTELKQDNVNALTIDGKCTTLTALSDFVANLEASGYFKKSVEIVNSQVDQAQPGAAALITFSVKAVFSPPEAPLAQTVPSPPGARPGGPSP